VTHRIVLVSPGGLGTELATHLVSRGVEVVSPLTGRSDLTRIRASQAGIRDAGSLEEAVTGAELILSLVPPGAALEVARDVAAVIAPSGVRPVFVDANSVSPATVAEIESIIGRAGGRFVDAAIIAPTPRSIGTTRIYASGPALADFLDLASVGGLVVRPLGNDAGRASALKMAYSCVSKGLPAMAVGMFVIAASAGLYDDLMAELAVSQPEVLRRMPARVERLPSVADRWASEADEIARTFRDVGLSPSLFEGVAEVYRAVGLSASARAGSGEADRDPDRDESQRRLAALIDTLTAELSA